MALRRIPIRRSGNRENLFLGGDRELVMLAALIAFTLVFVAQNLVSIVIGVAFWIGALYLARLMGKSDPKLRHVYLRHRLYANYYPPRSTPFRNNSEGQGRRYR